MTITINLDIVDFLKDKKNAEALNEIGKCFTVGQWPDAIPTKLRPKWWNGKTQQVAARRILFGATIIDWIGDIQEADQGSGKPDNQYDGAYAEDELDD